MQTSDSGRKGAEKGHATAWYVADLLGMTDLNDGSGNLFVWGKDNCVVKTAGINTDQIKIPKQLYEKVAVGIVAKEIGEDSVALYKITRRTFDATKEESAGKSAATQWTFHLRRLLSGLQPFKECRPIEYRVESYWPNPTPREYSAEYHLWAHDDKLERVNSIPSGSKILFYETEKDQFKKKIGAMTVFASGTLTDRFENAPMVFDDPDGRTWRQHRIVELDAWVKPGAGVPFDVLRGALGRRKGWAMQTCPYPIPPKVYNSVRENLLKCSGVKSLNKPDGGNENVARKGSDTGKYGSLSLRSEEEQIRLRSSGMVKARALHNSLTNSFRKYCENTWGVVPSQDNFDAVLELKGNRILIEAKSTSVGGEGRQQIREAIGQLFDYRFEHWPDNPENTLLAVLLPEAPPERVQKLLSSLGIGIIYRLGENFIVDERLSGTLSKK